MRKQLWPYLPINPRRLVCGLQNVIGLGLAVLWMSCGQRPATPETQSDPQLTSRGTVQVTAQLVEIPEGAIFKRELYDYATVLKYKVLKVHRGEVKSQFIYVAHYNPFKPRNEAADARVKDIGGTLRSFQAGQVQELALELPVEDHFMGGLVNKYFGKTTDPLYWAIWTNRTRQ